MTRNPYLNPDEMPPGAEAGRGYIEAPGDTFFNMVWQSRRTEPDEYQIQLCNALESMFMQGTYELSEIVRTLQQSSVKLPGDKQWDEETFIAEIHRLSRQD